MKTFILTLYLKSLFPLYLKSVICGVDCKLSLMLFELLMKDLYINMVRTARFYIFCHKTHFHYELQTIIIPTSFRFLTNINYRNYFLVCNRKSILQFLDCRSKANNLTQAMWKKMYIFQQIIFTCHWKIWKVCPTVTPTEFRSKDDKVLFGKL